MLKVAPIFTDGAVLCRRKEIRIFGEAEEGAEVRCELRDEKDRLLARFQEMAGEEYPAKVQLEINPASLA